MLVAAILTSVGAGITMPVMNIVFGMNISEHCNISCANSEQVVWWVPLRDITAKMLPRHMSSSKRQSLHARKLASSTDQPRDV